MMQRSDKECFYKRNKSLNIKYKYKYKKINRN